MTTDRNSEAVALLPCPFDCGAKHPPSLNADGFGGWQVTCPHCFASTHEGGDSDSAVRSWNRRASVPVAGLEALVERAEDLLHRVEGFGSAYPTDIFSEPTKDEREWLHATKPGLMDRIAASMGRHVWSCIEKDIGAIRTELAQLIQEAK